VTGFSDGQTISIDNGTNSETAVIVSIRRFGADTITVAHPLTLAHASGAQVSGTGISLSTALTREHTSGVPVAGSASTPGTPNHYYRRPH
jgi:non-reducing end alpha-L-arabinofuranosidase